MPRTGRAPRHHVLGVSPGSYHYFVHDYTNRDVHRSTALARSGAEVRVYHGGQTYRFRANNESAGTIWNVCDIDVTPSGAAVVKKLDKYETRSIAAAVDLVFLLDVSPLGSRVPAAAHGQLFG